MLVSLRKADQTMPIHIFLGKPTNTIRFICCFWRSSLGAAWATKDHFGGIRSFSDLSRNPQIKKHRLLNVSRDSFRRTSGVSMRDRCPVISNPWFIQKLRFFIDLFMVGVSLASRWGNLLITQWISMALFKFPRFYLAMGGFRV